MLFDYHPSRIENSEITYHDTEKTWTKTLPIGS